MVCIGRLYKGFVVEVNSSVYFVFKVGLNIIIEGFVNEFCS